MHSGNAQCSEGEKLASLWKSLLQIAILAPSRSGLQCFGLELTPKT
jgi:hypothetical protein